MGFGEEQLLALGPMVAAAGQAAQTAAAFSQAREASKVAKSNARAERQAAAIREDAVRRDSKRRIASAVTAAGASGGGFGGSTAQILAEEALQAEHNALLTRFAGEVQATRFENEAASAKRRGTASLIQGGLRTGQTLITGAIDFEKATGRQPTPFDAFAL